MRTFFDEILFDIEGLRKINTITKYPSILTYHNLGPKGSLVDSLVEDTHFDGRTVYITEKIDGTNSRVVFFTDANGAVNDYIIGSREEILFAHGDRVINPTQGIVKNMKPIADAVKLLSDGNIPLEPNSIYCLYGETYGGNINGAKQYSGHGNYGIRIFDLWHMPYTKLEDLLELEVSQLSTWREHAGQPFVTVDELREFCNDFCVEMVPYIKQIVGNEIPLNLQGVWDWMQEFAQSNAQLDRDAHRMSEGVVVRYADRSLIRKIRFEDYQRTKRMGLIR